MGRLSKQEKIEKFLSNKNNTIFLRDLALISTQDKNGKTISFFVMFDSEREFPEVKTSKMVKIAGFGYPLEEIKESKPITVVGILVSSGERISFVEEYDEETGRLTYHNKEYNLFGESVTDFTDQKALNSEADIENLLNQEDEINAPTFVEDPAKKYHNLFKNKARSFDSVIKKNDIDYKI